ncbi:MAG TPA: TadE/TadG family type IV pilus assembly protein [Gemmataceae bacterium]|nr:TadE/TadG family type IV pilus assembly protein [Gemmataceae bacterium]
MRYRRQGVAAVEFALCLPVIVLLLLGIWEVGRIVEVSNVMWNGAREAARDASVGQDNLQTVASNTLTYLQNAMPTTFNPSHSTTMKSPVVTMPANTTGYTCWDNTANQELFTITFTDITQTSVTDPTTMSKLDHYQIGLQVPYTTIRWNTLTQITGVSRISITVDWVCMQDSPFSISNSLPAE